MKLDVPFLQLPLSFDAQVLAREIEALGESAWRPHPQGFPGNSALPVVSVNGDPASDAVRGPMRPTPQLLACPYLMEVMHSIGAVWGRSRLMRLSGQAEVMPHVDINYYWREHMRVHVPIVTQPTVRFLCGDAELNMAAGECWIFDTWRTHRVHNDDHRARIHLVADTVGGRRFWEHMRTCRPHDRDVPGWRPRQVAPGEVRAELQYESVNLPLVMSPWEVREHVAFLLSEARPSDALHAFSQRVMAPFVRNWQALWAQHGDSGAGLGEFRALGAGLPAQLVQFEALMLRNGVSLIKAFRALVLGNLVSDGAVADVEVRDQPLPIPSAPSAAMLAAQPSAAAVRAVPATSASSSQFERPLIILSAPRSGSTLLFETLAKAPGLFTIGGESHRAIESIPGLHPSARNYDSNRLAAADATAAVITAVRQNFSQGLRDRAGNAPLPRVPVRLLEKTPKNALRLPFLRQVFADGHFIYLYREPREVLASMIEAWRSGRFRTYPTLPGWSGPPWSLLLIPGWRDLEGRPLEEVVARQWATTTDMLLDDLQMLPVEKLSRVRYDALVKQPQVEIDRLCGELGLDWDTALGELALSRHTISRPDPDKWKQHEDVLRKVLPMVEDTRARAERFVAG